MKTHQPCPKCDSSDAATIWEDSNSFYCHSCKKGGLLDDNKSTDGTSTSMASNLPDVASKPHRGVETKILKEWGIRGPNKEGHFYFPLYVDGELVNYKVNQPNQAKQKYTYLHKGFKQTDYDLPGSHIPDKSTKAVTIVFGMWDGPSLAQMLGGYPVRIVQSDGIALECIEKNFEDLNKFETIKLLLDNDEACRKSVDVQKIAATFPGKVEVVDLPSDFPKDANEALTSGKSAELVKRWWASQPVKLKAFCDLDALHTDIFSHKTIEYHSYPWDNINKTCWGWKLGHLDVFLAGSSIGKSLLLADLSYHILTTGFRQAVFFLEDSEEEAVLRYMSLDSGIPFHKPDEEYNVQDKEAAWGNTLGTKKLLMFDQKEYGRLTSKDILNLIELVVRVHGVQVVILDHISYIMSGNASENTLALTDEFLTNLKQLCTRLGIYVATCCHLRKNTGGAKTWEEGAIPTMEDARGTGAVYQLANNIFSAARNKMAEDFNERNTTHLYVNKCRASGFSGHGTDLLFTMRPFKLEEVDNDN